MVAHVSEKREAPTPGQWDKVKRFYFDEKVRAAILTIIILADLLLLYLAFIAGEEGISIQKTWLFIKLWCGKLAGFNARQWVALITPLAAIVIAEIAHRWDEAENGCGLRHATKQMGGRAYNLDTGVIAASITKQSVLAAIASILIFLVQNYPKGQSDFLVFVTFLSTCGFLAAILLLLVSIICYDYACRFNWRTYHKAELIRKALRLDIYSWYILLASFVLSISLINARLSSIMGMIAGLSMWWYYFFRPEKARDKVPIRGISRIEINVKDLDKAEEFYREVIGFRKHHKKGKHLCLQSGGWTQIILKQVDAKECPPQKIAFAIAEIDIDSAAKFLDSQGVKIERTHMDGRLQSIRFKDQDDHLIEFNVPLQTVRLLT